MNIVVLVKQVPDTWAERKLRDTDKTLDRESVDAVINEIDEYAVEEALRIREQLDEAHRGSVTVLSMGPQRAIETIRKALAMGVDKAVHLTDEALHGSCAPQTSLALANVLRTLDYDLVICGSEAVDARVSAMGALLAERLAIAQLTGARKVEIDGSTVRIERQTENGYQLVEASLPAVVSVVEKTNEPRYPSFKGIMAAKKKPLTTLSIADAGIDPADVGLANATSAVVDFTARPPRQAGQIVTDGGDGGRKLAEYLVAQKII
jgi:electron transfer flavoprotein beta subunit